MEIRRADSYTIWFCDSPTCGMHIIAKDKEGNMICEIVTSAAQTFEIVQLCQDHLYDKATQIVQ